MASSTPRWQLDHFARTTCADCVCAPCANAETAPPRPAAAAAAAPSTARISTVHNRAARSGARNRRRARSARGRRQRTTTAVRGGSRFALQPDQTIAQERARLRALHPAQLPLVALKTPPARRLVANELMNPNQLRLSSGFSVAVATRTHTHNNRCNSHSRHRSLLCVVRARQFRGQVCFQVPPEHHSTTDLIPCYIHKRRGQARSQNHLLLGSSV